MNVKYEFTGETKTIFGTTLKQIRVLRAIGLIAAGSIGGWIESEKNLDVSGDAWVSGNAHVSGNARVSGDAHVFGNARVSGNAHVSGDARVSGNAHVSGDARVSGNAWVYGVARVSGNARVFGDAHVFGNAWVSGNAHVSGDARVSGNAHYITISPIGSEGGCLTAFVQKDGSVILNRGCFTGTIEEFVAAVRNKHGGTLHEKTYMIAVDLIVARLDCSGAQKQAAE